MNHGIEQLSQIIDTFIRADTWSDSQQIVEAHPELLSDEAEALLKRLVEVQDNDEIRQLVEEHLNLLQRCREVGVEQAFTEKIGIAPTFPRELEPALQEIIHLTRPDDMARRAELCQQAIALVRREQNAPLWAALHNTLGNSLAQILRGDLADNIERAIRAYEEALEVWTRHMAPVQWAKAMNNMAVAYRNRILGQPAENLDRAIEIYQQVLEVQTRESASTDWADAMSNLGVAYSNRIHGDRAENLERAIDAYHQALEVRTRSAMPLEWAKTMNNLAAAYQDRIQGDRVDNLELAIMTYEHILEVTTYEDMPIEWATTMTNLASAYYFRIRGDRAENLESAIEAYKKALGVRTRQTMPADWANTMMNLATAHCSRIRGNRAENLERAIEIYQQALQVFTREAMPLKWAETMHNLANSYHNRILGHRAENIEKAIEASQHAIQVWTKQAMPIEWAATVANLATTYTDRVLGDHAENLERAIELYQQALEVQTREAMPIQWAETTHNLATAYSERIRGDRSENLERAIELYQQALEVRTREAMPIQWAETTDNLANVYHDRTQGDRAENLELAIELYQQALEVRTHRAAPIDWANTMNNLASSYIERIRGDQGENIEHAIAAFQQVIEVQTREAIPLDRATAMINLANAYSKRIHGDKTENIEMALKTYQQVFDVLTRENMPLVWARSMHNLGLAYSDRILGDRGENTKRAIEAFRQALEVFQPDTLPNDCRRVAYGLGNSHYGLGNWQSAYTAYAIGIRAAEALYRSAFVPASQQTEIEENAKLYDRMIATCLRLRDASRYARDCLIYAEGSKARTFLDQLGHASFPPPLDAPRHLLSRESEMLSQLRRLQQELVAAGLSSDQEREIATRRKIIQDELERIWEALVQEHSAAREYVALRRAESPTWDDMARLSMHLGSETAIVEFYTLDDEIAAFVLRDGWEVPRIFVLPISRQQLLYRYLLPYSDEVLNHYTGRPPTYDWLTLGEVLLAPLESVLDEVRLVYFIPHGWLHFFPLHALTVKGAPFIARSAVAYAPSAAVLARVLERPSINTNNTLVIGYTSNINSNEHELFLGEAQAIAAHFKCQPLLEGEANADALRRHAPAACRIHLSCHGNFNSDDPLASSVQLAEGSFTVRDWMGLQLHADLVVLSACETGLISVGRGDEIVGFARALLYAGASSVLVTLWPVSATTTLEWMLDFYNRIWNSATGEKQHPEAFAFQQATLALREKHPDPYYWAPFTLIGDWH